MKMANLKCLAHATLAPGNPFQSVAQLGALPHRLYAEDDRYSAERGEEFANLLRWAVDLGYSPTGLAAGEAGNLTQRQASDDMNAWVKRMKENASEMFSRLVPTFGCAETLQGELVRAVVRLECEYHQNLMWNWGDGFYESLVDLIERTMNAEETFSRWVKQVLAFDLHTIRQAGKRGQTILSGSADPKTICRICEEIDVEESLARLHAIVAVWCERHDDPIPYEDPSESPPPVQATWRKSVRFREA